MDCGPYPGVAHRLRSGQATTGYGVAGRWPAGVFLLILAFGEDEW